MHKNVFTRFVTATLMQEHYQKWAEEKSECTHEGSELRVVDVRLFDDGGLQCAKERVRSEIFFGRVLSTHTMRPYVVQQDER